MQVGENHFLIMLISRDSVVKAAGLNPGSLGSAAAGTHMKSLVSSGRASGQNCSRAPAVPR